MDVHTTPTLTEVRDRYVSWLRASRDLSNHTVRAYHADVTALARSFDEQSTIDELDPTAIRRFFDQQRMSGLRSTSLRRRSAGIRSFCRYLDQEQIVPSSPWPVDGFAFQRTRSLPRAVPPDDLARLLDHLVRDAEVDDDIYTDRPLPKPRAATTLLGTSLMLTTGLRVSELVSFRTDDIDLANRTIQVLGKGRRERIVYLTDDWMTRLAKAYLTTREHLCVTQAPFLFNIARGPLSTASMRQRLIHAGRAAGLRQRVTPHMLRHSAATQLIESGVNIRFVQRLLGHASLTTTEIYTHVTDQALRCAVVEASVLRRSRHRH